MTDDTKRVPPEPKIECTSTHCERRQECASPSECTGSAKVAEGVMNKPSAVGRSEEMGEQITYMISEKQALLDVRDKALNLMGMIGTPALHYGVLHLGKALIEAGASITQEGVTNVMQQAENMVNNDRHMPAFTRMVVGLLRELASPDGKPAPEFNDLVEALRRHGSIGQPEAAALINGFNFQCYDGAWTAASRADDKAEAERQVAVAEQSTPPTGWADADAALEALDEFLANLHTESEPEKLADLLRALWKIERMDGDTAQGMIEVVDRNREQRRQQIIDGAMRAVAEIKAGLEPAPSLEEVRQANEDAALAEAGTAHNIDDKLYLIYRGGLISQKVFNALQPAACRALSAEGKLQEAVLKVIGAPAKAQRQKAIADLAAVLMR